MSLTLYISSNCKSPTICDFEFFLSRVRSQSQVFVVFAVKGCLTSHRGEKIKNHKLSEICIYLRYTK